MYIESDFSGAKYVFQHTNARMDWKKQLAVIFFP